MFTAGKIKGGITPVNYVVTEGSSISQFWGFSDDGVIGSFGSLDVADYAGIHINGIYYSTITNPNDKFYIILEGNLNQGVFDSVVTIDHTLYASSADSFSYSATYDHTGWEWHNLTKPTSWDGLTTSAVTIIGTGN